MPPNTVKIGIMDEERRTTVNLKECIRAARERGGLHQHRLPRPHRRRDPHLDGGRADGPQGRDEAGGLVQAYEDRNVDIGLACGLRGHAQIGKGMWAMPDLMAAMLEQKIAAPEGRRQQRLGAVADRRHAARHPLPPGRRRRGAGAAADRARRRRSTTS